MLSSKIYKQSTSFHIDNIILDELVTNYIFFGAAAIAQWNRQHLLF